MGSHFGCGPLRSRVGLVTMPANTTESLVTGTTRTETSSLTEFYGTHYSANPPSKSDRSILINRVLVDLGPFKRGLDIGCGDGSVTLEHASNCSEILGLEVAFDACRAGRRRGLPVIRGSALSVPFKGASFDLIIAGEIIEHMVDPDHMLDELWRLLRPGGYCVITTPNLASWYNRFLLLIGFQPYHTDVSLWHQVGKLRNVADVNKGSGHLMMFTLRALRELLLLHGFDLIALRGCGVDIRIPGPLRILERTVAAFPGLASILVAFVRKPPSGVHADARTNFED